MQGQTGHFRQMSAFVKGMKSLSDMVTMSGADMPTTQTDGHEAADRIHVLLIEDDAVDREQVFRLLGAEFSLSSVAHGGDALRFLDGQQPDAVLLDYHLPDMEGMALLPQLVERDLPVILLTGENRPEVIVEAMQRGAQDYLVKGQIDRSALAHAIQNAVEKVALKRELAQHQIQLANQAAALRRSNARVRALASALTLAEQRERRRISRILHDHVQQMLYGIQMRLYLFELDVADYAGAEAHVSEMGELIEEAINATRTLTVELSPPVLRNEGLAAALAWLANHMEQLYDLRVHLALADEDRLPSDELRVLVFQLARELLFNVVKHAQVKEASIAMESDEDCFVLRIADEGVGMDPSRLESARGEAGGFGLYQVRERLELFGGEVKIQSAPGTGTCVEVRLPAACDL